MVKATKRTAKRDDELGDDEREQIELEAPAARGRKSPRSGGRSAAPRAAAGGATRARKAATRKSKSPQLELLNDEGEGS